MSDTDCCQAADYWGLQVEDCLGLLEEVRTAEVVDVVVEAQSRAMLDDQVGRMALVDAAGPVDVVIGNTDLESGTVVVPASAAERRSLNIDLVAAQVKTIQKAKAAALDVAEAGSRRMPSILVMLVVVGLVGDVARVIV